MAIGTTAAIVLGLGAAGAGIGLSRAMGKQVGQFSSPQPLPQAPSPDSAVSKAEDIVKKKRAAATQTVYTNPLGIGGQANVARTALKEKTGQ